MSLVYYNFMYFVYDSDELKNDNNENDYNLIFNCSPSTKYIDTSVSFSSFQKLNVLSFLLMVLKYSFIKYTLYTFTLEHPISPHNSL